MNDFLTVFRYTDIKEWKLTAILNLSSLFLIKQEYQLMKYLLHFSKGFATHK